MELLIRHDMEAATNDTTDILETSHFRSLSSSSYTIMLLIEGMSSRCQHGNGRRQFAVPMGVRAGLGSLQKA
jgi:hypothetical protein